MCTLTVPNPSEFKNIGLYFISHLDNDMILQSQPKFIVPLIMLTDYLAKTFASLISQHLKTAQPLLTVIGHEPCLHLLSLITNLKYTTKNHI